MSVRKSKMILAPFSHHYACLRKDQNTVPYRSVPGRFIISNCGFYTENISSFLHHYFQPIAQKVNAFKKDTHDF